MSENVSMMRKVWQLTLGWNRRQQFKQFLLRRYDSVAFLIPDYFRYNKKFYEFLDDFSRESYPVLAKSIYEDFHPNSVVDIGCGNGLLLLAFKKLGCTKLQGYEGSSSGVHFSKKNGVPAEQLDLRFHFKHQKSFDVVTCFEVAEHLDAKYADAIVDTICGFAPIVVFSAAIPGQGGTDHRNEQPNEYWIEKFEKRGFLLDRARTDRYRADWNRAGNVSSWYCQNVLVFLKKS